LGTRFQCLRTMPSGPIHTVERITRASSAVQHLVAVGPVLPSPVAGSRARNGACIWCGTVRGPASGRHRAPRRSLPDLTHSRGSRRPLGAPGSVVAR
jgi:hypothetical protein